MSRNLIIFLCLASLMDAGLTDMGIRLHVIGEANPVMRFLYEHSHLAFYGIKILIPIPLFFLAAKVSKHLYIKHLFRFSTICYMGILVMHAFWISSTLSQSLNI
ncbi:DUF5658 family protein [Paenibacillus roseipurpureus]|uniref:DUF5658 family protein n=1 Tax=Paenibacillus roseopurpureus TaxID=2918901 RepID=A0AA96LP63_9BACL|nr:DUF5658 family protein [Paenibacillus sp. MBLB1832]WNR42370.1 DUF5658 family protein [Paenibacillus sp. MBLB1832]